MFPAVGLTLIAAGMFGTLLELPQEAVGSIHRRHTDYYIHDYFLHFQPPVIRVPTWYTTIAAT